MISARNQRILQEISAVEIMLKLYERLNAKTAAMDCVMQLFTLITELEAP